MAEAIRPDRSGRLPRSLLHPGTSSNLSSSSSLSSLSIAAKGFRPFFLLAAVFAVAIVPLWLLVLHGTLSPTSYLDATSWHAHEMIFGFVVAVMAGFLLTAVGNWTKRETVVGAPLLALAALWVLGRLAMGFSAVLPRGVVAVADLAFLPALLFVLARPLIAAKNRRNFVMLAVVGALFMANLAVHLEALNVLVSGSARRATRVSVDLVLLIISIIAGRVFPMFTRNATGIASIRSIPAVDALAIAAMAALTLLDAVSPYHPAAGLLSGCAGVLAATRMWHWGGRHSLKQPLLWILHAGYGWLALGLILRGITDSTSSSFSSLATHTLTIGAIGSLTLGMMARVALGHTGRMLATPPAVAVAFVAITLAAVARGALPLVAPHWYFASLVTAGALWVLAFGTFLVVYAPILWSPRVDGTPG